MKAATPSVGLLFALFTVQHVALAQQAGEAGVPPIKTYAVKAFSGAAQVWTMVRDQRGVLYTGTSHADIHQYDGSAWRNIRGPSSIIRSLAVDRDGTIWVGAAADFGRLEPDARGALQYVSLLEKVPAEHRRFGDIWVRTTSQGVFFRAFARLFQWDGTRLKAWTATGAFEGLSEVNGHIYVSQTGVGLQELVDGQLRPVPGGEALSRSTRVYMHSWDERRVLITARAEPLKIYDGQTVSPFRTEADDYFKSNQVYYSIPLADGGFCVTTLLGGAVILERDGRLRRIIGKESGLPESGIYSALQDADGSLWLGQGLTLSRVEVNSPLLVLARTSFSDVARFNGTLYGANAAGGPSLYRFVPDRKTGVPALHPIPTVLTQVFAFTLFRDPSGGRDQLLGASGNGIVRIEGDTVSPALPARFGPPESTFQTLQSRKYPNRVYASHPLGTASSIRWEGGNWIDEGKLRLPYTGRSLVEDGEGTVWVGSVGAVLRFENAVSGLRDARMEVFSEKDGVTRGQVVLRWIGGQLYAYSLQGPRIVRWERSSRKFVPDDRFFLPLPDERSSVGLWEHPNGDVWSKTSGDSSFRTGIFRRAADGSYRLDEDPVKGLDLGDTQNAFVETDGSILFGSRDGMFRFNPRAGAPAGQPFRTLIRGVKPFAGELLFGGDRLAEVNRPSLAYDSNSLRFEFAAPVFGNEDATEYQFFLEGADKDWREWNKQREANYNRLSSGSYRFRVRARNFEGRVGEEASYAFTVLPPWYRSGIAYSLYTLMLLFTVIGARRAVVRHEQNKARRGREALEAQAKALEATVAERTREIRDQAGEIAAQKDHIQHAYETVELLSEIGREITASLDLDTILFKLYERVNQLVDASVFGVGLYRPEKNQIEYTLAIENGKRYAPYTRDSADKNQFAVWCIDNRRAVLLNDVEKEYSNYIPVYRHAGYELEDGTRAKPPASMIYLPLIVQDRVLGILTVQSFRANAYTEHHLGLLENLAAYTTIALDNAGAYRLVNEREKEVAARAAELATINRITQALAEKLDLNSVIQLVGEQLRILFNAPIAYVALLDRASMMIHFPYSRGEDSPSIPYGKGLTSQIIQTGQPLLINRDLEGSRASLGIEKVGRAAASFLGVPIPAGGEIIGVISVQTDEQENRFSEADQRLLTTVASAVGVAIHNARLFEETRQARAAAEEADAAKSSFLSTVSHELRTPLTSVLGFAKIIRRRLEERLLPLIPGGDRKVEQAKTQVLDNLGVVVSEGERLTKLIDDVLDLAKIEAGKFTWNMGTVSVSDLIERAVSATSSLFEGKAVQLVQDVAPALPEVTGDRDRLIQVIINLISNAVKFTPSGTVTVSARARGGEITVSVTDSGIGIAPEDHQKVFEKFKQVGDTLTDKPRGTGLGLPICREIVEHHGGRISVESRLGEGSTFTFTLPVPEAARQEGRPLSLDALVRHLRERVASHKPGNKSILVVDDDPHIRSLLQQEFTEAGYHVRLAADGREALQRIREERPGLVVLDVMMPEMNGFDVAAVLKNDPDTMDIPIIILSIVEDKERGFRIGVDRYLTKPIDTQTLFHEVNELLDQGKSHRKVMIVDEDASAVRTLTQVLEAGGYHVVESNGAELTASAIAAKPDIIILNSIVSGRREAVQSLRFERGLENVLFLIYQR